MTTLMQLHRTIKIRLLLQFITNLATMAIMPFIAIYFSNLVGSAITGILIIVVICSGLAGGLCGGFWSDKIGRKKLMIIAEVGMAITYLLIATVNSSWIVMPYVSFILFAVNMFFNGIYIPVSSAMIYDIVQEVERRFVFTIMYWISNLATALGSITGAFLFMEYHFYIFITVAMISLISATITYLYISETHYPKKTDTTPVSMYSNYKSVFGDKLYIIFLIAGLLVFSLEAHLTNYIAVHLENTVTSQKLLGLLTIDGIKMVGILQAENTVLVVFAVGLVTWMARNKSDSSRLIGGMSLYVISYVLLSYTSIPELLLFFMLLISVGELIFIPIRQSVLAEMTQESKRSSYLALDSFAQQGTMIIGGAAVTLGSFFPPYLMSSLFLAMGLTSVVLMKYVMNKREVNRATETRTPEIRTI